MSYEEDIAVIKAYVQRQRERMKIREDELDWERHPESSCIMARGGEFGNLLYAQLLFTHENYGGWQDLRDGEIRAGVLERIAIDSAGDTEEKGDKDKKVA